MKHRLAGFICAALCSTAMGAEVGISINVGEPGFFGQLDIGGIPQPPPLVFAQPVVVVRAPGVTAEPVYLHVPPGHEKHWAKHCAEYHACGRAVYFVRDDWYQREYVPHYQRGEWREHRHEEDRRGDRDHDHGHDREHGRDHDHDHDH
ncbi:MAG TPA: hypothetical protein VGI93_20135 [Steroidobacteraceae bacterium]|jgi:hypothetical protein